MKRNIPIFSSIIDNEIYVGKANNGNRQDEWMKKYGLDADVMQLLERIKWSKRENKWMWKTGRFRRNLVGE